MLIVSRHSRHGWLMIFSSLIMSQGGGPWDKIRNHIDGRKIVKQPRTDDHTLEDYAFDALNNGWMTTIRLPGYGDQPGAVWCMRHGWESMTDDGKVLDNGAR
jgi:hypothetical protein